MQISAESATNSLIVVAKPSELDELDKLIETLDVEPESARKRQIESIKLQYAQAWSVQDAINRMFRSSRNPRDQITAVPEYGSNSVIVSASDDNMARVKTLIAQMDSADSNNRSVEVVSIEHAEASSVARALNDIYVRSAPRSRGGGQPITISEVRGSKAIMVKAGAEDLVKIKDTIKELDSDTFITGGVMRVVQLLQGDAEELLTVLQEYLRKPGGRGRNPELAGDVRLSAMTAANAIVISGDQEEVDRIEAKIHELDEATEDTNTPRFIRLAHVRASQILPTVQDLFSGSSGGRNRGRGRGRSSSQAPVIMANEPLNLLIVKAGPADFSAIEAIVEQLDTEEGTTRETVKIVQVSPSVPAVDLAQQVQDTINEGAVAMADQFPGMTVPRITITADARTSSLWIAGSSELFAQAEDLIRTAEKMAPSGGTKISILRPPPGMSAEDLKRLIGELTAEDASSGSSRRGSARRGSTNRRRSTPASRGGSRRRR